jgi:hypothetical protein
LGADLKERVCLTVYFPALNPFEKFLFLKIFYMDPGRNSTGSGRFDFEQQRSHSRLTWRRVIGQNAFLL